MTLVLATDFSPASERAGRVVARMAKRTSAPVRMVHVSTDPRALFVLGTSEDSLLADSRRALAEAAARLRSEEGATVEEELCAGPVADALVAAAERVVASALVVAEDGPRPSVGPLGGVAERVTRQARFPVLALREPAAFEAWLRGERPLRVMVGTDLGASSTRALRFVAGLGAIGPVDLIVACVAQPDETSLRLGLPPPADHESLAPGVEETLRRELVAQAQGADLIPGRVIVQASSAGPEGHLVKLAERERVDLVVVGVRKRSWLEQAWYGSVAREVLRAASTNIACIPRPLAEEAMTIPEAPRVILVGTDLSPLGDAAVPCAYALVREGGVVHLVHVIEAGSASISMQPALDEELLRRLSERIPQGVEARNVRTERHVISGPPAEALVALAERVGADALCVGSHGRSGLGAAVLGSVSQEIIAKSRRPVVVVPGSRE